MHQDFLRGSPAAQRRTTMLTAAALVVLVAVAAACWYGVTRFSGDDDSVSVRIYSSTVAPGVKPGTDVILRGAEVGTIDDVSRAPDGSLALDVTLTRSRITGVTDTFDIDFRPANYFGVTALNLTPRAGGSALGDGLSLRRDPLGDFTMSRMIERGSIIASGTLSDEMLDTLDTVLRYTNALTPLLESGLAFADMIAKTQKALPSEQLRDANAVLASMPRFIQQTADGAYQIFQGVYNRRPDGSLGMNYHDLDNSDAGLAIAGGALFSAAGNLLKSHDTELTPAVSIVTAFSDAVPGMLGSGTTGPKLRLVIDRLTAAFGGTAGRPSLRLRLVMNDLPGLAAPLAQAGLRGGSR